VPTGGPEDNRLVPAGQGGDIPEATATELTDEELSGRVQAVLAGVEDGTLAMFYDADSLKEYMNNRLPR